MVRHLFVITLVAALFCALPALAVEKEGTVKMIDTAERTITLDDGTKVWLGDGVAADALKEGDVVKVDYEERDGKPVATSVEMK